MGRFCTSSPAEYKAGLDLAIDLGLDYGCMNPGPACRAVPELTRSADIQLNKRLSFAASSRNATSTANCWGTSALGVIEAHG
jgi:hypothetical protein